jgi:hypothetical protein
MTNANRIQKLVVGALLALAAFAGPAAAGDGTPTPPGGTPELSAVEPAVTLTLPRTVRPGTAASIAVRIDGPEAAGLRADRVTCAFRLGNRSLAGTPRLSGGKALCVVRVPRNAAGKTVRGAVRVVLTHVTIERQFAFKVARA